MRIKRSSTWIKPIFCNYNSYYKVSSSSKFRLSKDWKTSLNSGMQNFTCCTVISCSDKIEIFHFITAWRGKEVDYTFKQWWAQTTQVKTLVLSFMFGEICTMMEKKRKGPKEGFLWFSKAISMWLLGPQPRILSKSSMIQDRERACILVFPQRIQNINLANSFNYWTCREQLTSKK